MVMVWNTWGELSEHRVHRGNAARVWPSGRKVLPGDIWASLVGNMFFVPSGSDH